MISFVGAGPGACDLITLRGAKLLQEADVVIYAGSLVNEKLIDLCHEGVEVFDSSKMTLGEITQTMIEAARQGKEVVRLATGDVTLFGALAEMVRPLDEANVRYQVVPGVSSVFASSAALGLSYTQPEVSETLIVCRAEGRTAVPQRERLRELAKHAATMVILLSAGLASQVQEELLAGGYAPETPAAIVVRASWPDERVIRTPLKDLAACASAQGVERSATIIVGNVLSAKGAASRLYDEAFSHGYRQATART